MGKKVSLVVTALMASSFLLSGCCISHEWVDATCTTPKSCVKCEKTEGEALGHTWKDADCVTAKTCEICGETEGEALGHDWKDADCITAKKCKTCGKTEGEALGHEWHFATLDAPKTCNACGETEGEKVSVEKIDLSFMPEDCYFTLSVNEKVVTMVNNNGIMNFVYYDLDGNELARSEVKYNPQHNWGFRMYASDVNVSVGIVLESSEVFFLDWEGKECFRTTVKLNNHYDYYTPQKTSNEDVFGIQLSDGKIPEMYINIKTGETMDTYEEPNGIEYDDSLWSYYIYSEEIDGYYVVTADKSKAGFLDKEGNEIAMYADASNFTQYGYALVSNDGVTYSLIDKDFNVIKEDFETGNSALTSVRKYLYFYDENGIKERYIIK